VADVNLFTQGRIDRFETKNRMIMAPMTRSRALAKGVPSDLAIEYYAQRASAGLIISEGIAPSAVGLGYARTPAIENSEQIAAWKKITDAVHAKGGRMFVTDLTGSVYSANLDGSNKKTLLVAEGNLTGIAYVELPGRALEKSLVN